MKKIVVIGGGVAAKGFASAALALHDNIDLTIIRNEKRSPVPCGIPYAFGTLKDSNDNISSDKGLLDNGLNLVIGDVIEIDRDTKTIKLSDKSKMEYDKLVISTGSLPVLPPFKGINLEGIYVIEKDLDTVVAVRKKIEIAKSIVIVGGGFIGVELADEINKMGNKNITLVELAPHCLNVAFESDVSEEIEESLTKKGIRIATGNAVERLKGNDKVKKVVLNNGEEIDADLVFLSIGAYPNTKLAASCDLTVAKAGVIVDEFQKTSDNSIFAIGDCASKQDLFSDEYSRVRLASIAAKEGRNAAYNLFENKRILKPIGICNLFSTCIDGKYYAATGMTKEQCKTNGFEVIEILQSAHDKHPITLPNTKKIDGRFFFEKESMLLLGAQLSGPQLVAEVINAIGIAVQNKATAYDIYAYNYASHPMGTASPNKYIMHQAGLKALKVIK